MTTELLNCDDPTPANVVESLLLATKRATPCGGYTGASGGLVQAMPVLVLAIQMLLLLPVMGGGVRR